MEEHPFHYV